MGSENFSLKWNDFEKNISGGLREFRDSSDFLDVTLVCEQEQVQAHKLVLSACSPFFRQILTRNRHDNPLIYLRGVSYADITAILNFMYHGEVNVAQKDLNTFLSIAEDLKVKGLTQNSNSDESHEAKGQYIEKLQVKNSEHSMAKGESLDKDRKRSKEQTETEGPVLKKQKELENHDDENNIVYIKSEPEFGSVEHSANSLAISEVNYDPEPSETMTKTGNGAYREEGLDMDAIDRVDGLDGLLDYSNYSDYHEVSYGDGPQRTSYSLSKGLLKVEDEVCRLVERRQDGSFRCTACGKTSNRISNIKNHIEARHTSTTGYTCGLCNKFCRTKNSYHVHMSTKHREKSSWKRMETESLVHKSENCENNLLRVSSEPALLPVEPSASSLAIAKVNDGMHYQQQY